MKITHVESIDLRVNHRGNWLFLQLRTDSGITGLGEFSHSHDDQLALATLSSWESRIVGQDASAILSLWRSLSRPNAGRVAQTVLSAIEQALWDIKGQALGVPIHALLGGALRDSIRLYANINRHVTDRSPSGFARAAAQAVAEGFTAIKLAPFDEVRGSVHARTGAQAVWRPGIERVRAVRQAIGDDIDLAVDCHGRFDASAALLVARQLEPFELLWLEEPVPHQHIADLARITQQVTTPTASAESVFALEGFEPFVRERIVDVLMPDVKHDGGLLETQHIARAAQARGLLIAPHNPAGPVSTAATAQAISTASNLLILEYAWGEVPWRAELLDPPERIENGHLVLPTGPGLGHKLNHDLVQRFRIG